MATGFFVLPPELRLEIYHQAVTTSMASGKISDVGGLLFSCHEIYKEMTTDYISHVRPVLEAMNKWRIGHPARAPVKIELPKYNFHESPTEAEISIPYSSLWEQDARTMQYGQPWSYGWNFTEAFEDLLPMVHLPWLSLTVRVHFPSTDSVLSRTAALTCTYCVLSGALDIISQDSRSLSLAQVFPTLKVLVLCLDDCQDLSAEDGRHLAFNLADRVDFSLQKIRQNSRFLFPRRWATTKTQDGRVSWEMNFDLENWISTGNFSII